MADIPTKDLWKYTPHYRRLFTGAHYLANLSRHLELLLAWLWKNTQGSLRCPKCGDERRTDIKLLHGSVHFGYNQHYESEPPAKYASELPQLWQFQCVQCRTRQLGLAYSGPAGVEYRVLPSTHGGLSTPLTPEPVAFFLDQAARCESAGAVPAALAMFRAALEHLLLDQGFDAQMVGPKIGQLERQIEKGTAPRWAADMDLEILRTMKKLGDWSIHAGEGDIERHKSVDSRLIPEVKATFHLLLHEVYENPRKAEERLKLLKDVLAGEATQEDTEDQSAFGSDEMPF